MQKLFLKNDILYSFTLFKVEEPIPMFPLFSYQISHAVIVSNLQFWHISPRSFHRWVRSIMCIYIHTYAGSRTRAWSQVACAHTERDGESSGGCGSREPHASETELTCPVCSRNLSPWKSTQGTAQVSCESGKFNFRSSESQIHLKLQISCNPIRKRILCSPLSYICCNLALLYIQSPWWVCDYNRMLSVARWELFKTLLSEFSRRGIK